MSDSQPLPPVGTIGLTRIAGEVGKGIEFGQFLCGAGFKDWEHAFLLGPNGQILQAEPGGASIGHVSQYSDIYWCNSIAKLAMAQNTLAEIWVGAQQYKGVPYSFLDYCSIATHHLHVPAPGLENYIKSTKHMICSQLVDQAYTDKGVHLFNGRWAGDVMPLDLFNLDQTLLIQKLSGA